MNQTVTNQNYSLSQEERAQLIQKYEKQNSTILKICKFFVTPAPMILLLLVLTACQMPFLVIAVFRVANSNLNQAEMMNEVMNIYNSDYAAVSYIVYGIAGLILFGLWYGLVYVRKEPKKFNPLESISCSSIIMALAAALGSFGLVELFMTVLSVISPSAIESYAQRIEQSGIISFDGILPIICMYVVAPVVEELAIRGLCVKLLKWTGLGAVGILLMQAVYFGIMHLDPVQSSYTFLVGLVLGYMAYRYRSVYLSILTHVLFNITGTAIPALLERVPTEVHLAVYIGAIVLMIVLLLLDRFVIKANFWKKTFMELVRKE